MGGLGRHGGHGRAGGRRRKVLAAATTATAMIVALTAGSAPGAGAGTRTALASKADLTGTWRDQSGTSYEISGDQASGAFTATYVGSGNHASLIGTLTGTFNGSTFAGALLITEDSVVVNGAFTFKYAAGSPPTLAGNIDRYVTTLSCQSGPCTTSKACSYVGNPDSRAEAPVEDPAPGAPIEDPISILLLPGEAEAAPTHEGLDVILEARFGPCDKVSAERLAAIRRVGTEYDFFLAELENRPPKGGKLSKLVRETLALNEALTQARNPEGRPVFPTLNKVRRVLAQLVSIANGPPSNERAARAAYNLVLMVAFEDAGGGLGDGGPE